MTTNADERRHEARTGGEMSKYDELKRLAEAATPGPWSYDGSDICPARVEGETTYVESWNAIADARQMENVRFIAAANPAVILALIAECERLHTAHQQELERHRTTWTQLEQVKRDAERYRHLRAKAVGGPLCGLYGEGLDAEVDAEMIERPL